MNKFKKITTTIEVSVEIALPDFLDLSDPQILDEINGAGYPVESEKEVYEHAVLLLLEGGAGYEHDVFGYIVSDPNKTSETRYRKLDKSILCSELKDLE